MVAIDIKPPLKGVTTGKSGSGRRQDSEKGTRGVKPKPGAHLWDPSIQDRGRLGCSLRLTRLEDGRQREELSEHCAGALGGLGAKFCARDRSMRKAT